MARNGMTRRRVGLLVPSSNTVMEPDIGGGLPPDATLHTARMYLEDTTPKGESRMLDEHALPAAKDLATARPDVVVFGCTSAGALRGNDYDAELCRRISGLTGVATISVIASVRQAITASGARRVGVLTPYVDELNQRIRESLEADGVAVERIAGLGISDNFTIAEVPADQIVAFAERQLAGLDVDLVFVSCTNFPAMAAIPELRRRLGLPVVTSNQAAVAAVRRFLDGEVGPW
jgi:maleate isomerase